MNGVCYDLLSRATSLPLVVEAGPNRQLRATFTDGDGIGIVAPALLAIQLLHQAPSVIGAGSTTQKRDTAWRGSIHNLEVTPVLAGHRRICAAHARLRRPLLGLSNHLVGRFVTDGVSTSRTWGSYGTSMVAVLAVWITAKHLSPWCEGAYSAHNKVRQIYQFLNVNGIVNT